MRGFSSPVRSRGGFAALGLLGAAAALSAVLLIGRPTGQGAGSAASRLVLLNPGAASSEATLLLRGQDGACLGKEARIELAAEALPPGGMSIVDLSDADAVGLPGDCLAAASVSAKGADLAVLALTDAMPVDGGLSAYLGQPASLAATELWVPAWGDDPTAASQLAIANPGAQAAAVQVLLYDEEGRTLTCDACRIDLAAGTATQFPVAALGRKAGAAAGTARLSARQPVLAVAVGGGADGWAAPLPFAAGGDQWLPGLFAQQTWVQASPSALLARSLGAGTTSLRMVSAGKDISALLLLREAQGKLVSRLPLGPVGFAAALGQDLSKQEADLYGGQLVPTGAVAGLSLEQWQGAAVVGAAGPQAPATDLLLPYLWEPDKDHAAWILLSSAQVSSPAKAQVAIYPAGSRKSVARWSADLAPGGSAFLDLGNPDAFANLGRGPFWATVSSDLPLAAKVLLLQRDAKAVAAAAYEGLPTSGLAREQLAPRLRLGPGSPDQATETPSPMPSPSPSPRISATPEPPTATPGPGPSATDTATPTESSTPLPSATPTPRPTEPLRPTLAATELPSPAPSPDPRSGWLRILDVTKLGEAMGLQRLARGPDGTIWGLLEGPSGGRLVSLDPQGALRRYADRREGVAAEFARLARQGSLPGFWSVDAVGRVWVGAAHYDGRAWVQVLPEQADGIGALRPGDQSLALPGGQAWVAQEAQVDCALPRGCGRLGLRLVDAEGRQAEGVDLSGAEAQGQGEGQRLLYLGPLRPPASRGAGLQQAAAAVAVTSAGLHLLDENRMVDYPLLGEPARGRLRHGGEATVGFVGQGGLKVITWIEEQRTAGPRAAIYLQEWDGAGRRWRAIEELSSGASPLAALAAAGRRVTAAADGPDGVLWLGTDGGQLLARRGRGWLVDHVPGGALSRRILGIAPAPDGSVVLATQDAVYRYAGGVFREVGQIFLPLLGKTTP